MAGHCLLRRIAEARLEVVDLQPGRRGPPQTKAAQLAGLVMHVRRQLSHLAVQQQARLLLDRLELLGDGATEAARRRDWAVQTELVAMRKRRVQALC